MRRMKKIVTVLMALSLTVTGMLGSGMTAKADSCGGLAEEDVYTPGEDEVIKDPLLHWAIRASMNAIKSNVKLTADMVGDKSVRNISFELCSHADDFADWTKPYWIENLEGIQYAKSATMVDIGYTSAIEGKSIKDLSPLSALTQLDILILKQDGITDVSALKTLVNLSQLDLSMNRAIKDVSSIKDMKKLSTLNLSSNAIENVDDIKDLTKLQYLNISGNKISALPDMSKLTDLRTLLASDNKLTDVTPVGQLKNLEALDLTKNSGITDVKALAGLTHLDPDRTYLPTAEMKTDLFAAIDVNKIFELFNISKMTTGDLDNVQKALDAYDALTDEQKTYIDSKKVEATKNNKAKVEAGDEPEYYPEYDNGGVKQPILDRLEIKVVDKNGKSLPNVNFVRKRINAGATPSEYTFTTDKNGILTLKHTSIDAWYDKIVVEVDNTDDVKYVSNPEKIEYTVNSSIQTETVNGKTATGLEELQFVLIPEDEYVDKTGLEEVIQKAGSVEEEYKYTEETYKAYQQVLAEAQKVFSDVDASKKDVQKVTSKLEKSLSELKKADKLTTLKVIVRDANGNLFTRPFKFQYTSDKGGYNSYSDAYTGIMYLPASAAWEEGETWKLFPCYQELYSADPVINFTVGKENGKSYFKEINGETVGVDYEKEITVTWTGIETPGFEPRTPDNTVLKEVIEQMKAYTSEGYTPASFEVLTQAINKSEETAGKADATQEDYNAAVAELKKAAADLKIEANKVALGKEIAYKTSYSQANYTTATWKVYKEALENAEIVNADANASQEQVDAALQLLKDAESQLKWRADNSKLKENLQKAKDLNEDDYQSGWDALQNAIKTAEDVVANADATKAESDSANAELEKAMEDLVEKPTEVDYSCYQGVFRAKVMDEDGNPLKGVKFNAVIDGTVDDYPMVSDSNGIISYNVTGIYNGGKTTHIVLADTADYETEDDHYFTASGSGWVGTIDAIDGIPYISGIKLTYTLKKKSGGDTPAPEPGNKVLSDETTFRAKVVDEAGKAVDGVEFDITPDDPLVDTYHATSKNGVIEQKVDNADFMVTFTVKLAEGQKDAEGELYVCADRHTYKTNGNYVIAPKITEIDGKALAEAGEITFVLKKDGGNTPIPEPEDKVLSDTTTFRAKVVDETGKSVDGVEFEIIDKASLDAEPITVKSANGKIEHQINASTDIQKTYTVGMKENADWKCEDTHSFKTGGYYGFGNATITSIDDTALAEAGEITFVLKKDGGSTPEPVKADKTKLKEAVEIAGLKKEADYTPESWSEYQKAVGEAQKILDKEDATQEEVDAQIEALKAAVEKLVEIKKPVVTDKNTIRIKVVNEAGEAVNDSIAFKVIPDTGYPFNLYASKGVVEYPVSDGDYGTNLMTVQLKNESVQLDGKEYIVVPEKHEFTIQSSTLGTLVTKVDGEDVGNGKEVIFILTEKTVPVVDKSMLQAKVNEVKDMKQGDYTLNSYKAFKTAITEAETALDNPNATQQDVDQALSVLEEAQNNLKTVRGMRTLTIAVSSEDGSQLQSNIKFIRDNVYYNVQNTMFANDGTLVWKLTGYEDAGEYELYLPEDSAYIATPAVTKITIGKEDGTSVVEKINDVPAAEAQAGIRLLAKSTDACDKVTFRAYVQDEDGKVLPGISFNVLNGDPQVLTSDENGMIQYDVTVWDIDTEMTVSLQANDQWSCDKQVIFTVSEDPEVEGRGVISAIDGTAFAGGEKIVFVLRDKNKPQPVDKTGLEGAIKEAQAIEKDLYTEESYGVMEQALANALTVDRDDNATQENIDSAAQALRDAMNGLVKKEVPQPVNKEALGKAIKEAQALKKDDYTDASFTAFENALKNAVAINENAVATQEEVNNAEKTLRDAIAGLVKKDGETPTPNPEDKNQNKPNSNQQKPSDTNQTSNNTQPTNAAQNTTVKTGDTANFMIPIAGIGMAAILLVLAIVLRKKYRR